MLSNNDVNRYNSSIKGIVDAWYAQNLSGYTNMLEDAVYCNARNITFLGGWNPEGGSTASGCILEFKNYNGQTTNLACSNVTDQFAVSNNKAKLTYPVGLLQDEERYNINTSSLMVTGAHYWGLSSGYFGTNSAGVRGVHDGGGGLSYNVNDVVGARPVVSLSSGTVISSGSGSEESPWVVE